MGYYLLKLFFSALIIVVVSEVAKRSSLLGGAIASLPLTSLQAMVWIYLETKDVTKIAELSTSIFWLLIPSLLFLLLMPYFLKQQWNFYWALGLSCGLMLCGYYLMIVLLKHFGIA